MREPRGRHLAATRPMRRHRAWPWVLLVIFVLLVAMAGFGAYAAKTMYSQAKEVKAHEQNAVTMLSGFSGTNDLNSLDQVSQKLPQVQSETKQANDIAHGTLWNLAAKVPLVGNDIKTVQGMASTVDDITHDSIPQFINVVDQLKSAKLSEGDGQINLQPILQAQQQIKKANDSMQGEVRAYHQLPAQKAKLGMVRKAYDASDKKLDSLAEKIDELSKTFQIVPDFLGANQSHHYAVMSMTTSEVRSGGGLVGSIGSLTTNNGKIAVGDFQPNTVYIPYGPGKPTDSEMEIFNTWGPEHMSLDVRDLAAAPDTARTATMMREIWAKTPEGAKEPIDGVITIDPVFLQKLISINGNVKLSNGQVLDGQNTTEYLLNTVYKKFSPEQQDVLFGEVATQSIGNMFSNLDFQKLSQIAGIMGNMARWRHFTVYSFDKQTEQKYMENGYTGQTPSSEENPEVGVYVNEQNVSKMSWYIHRTSKITRTSTNATGARKYHVDYTMTNTMTNAELQSVPHYIMGVGGVPLGSGAEKTLIYAPAGGSISNLTFKGEATTPKQMTLNGKPLYASLATVMPGATVTFSFDVTTSPKTVSDLQLDQSPMGWEDPGVTYVNGSSQK
ncbi:DUF4012 domain-containing protein [Bifidobacterium sp. ESL0784]|uniref:DUF4012 domain-containing protein n=1 Tax=Bifidobacterium sp. ESL0784 TaxID=2983231 RepID=UPI0023F7C152|nr:DUF4012 domain-containing protein [Bifidobacterium sp. ESL0784]MDF7640323.1 DUF4012 domain-containing protein [Bifidobacterium sp. ESL0784]